MLTSGAVGLSRQRLRHRKLINRRLPCLTYVLNICVFLFVWIVHLKLNDLILFCSFEDLQNVDFDLDGKACAAIDQTYLMALYDTLFSQVNTPHCLIEFVFYRYFVSYPLIL